jgi:hypothetical protein
MAAMVTSLIPYNEALNVKEWILDSHTALTPRKVIQKRRVPNGNQSVIEDTITLSAEAVDAEGVVLPQRCSIEIKVRRPKQHMGTQLTTVLMPLARDFVSADEFEAVISKSLYLD